MERHKSHMNRRSPLAAPPSHAGQAMDDQEEALTLNLRSRGAGELAMEALPAPTRAGTGVQRWCMCRRLVTSECSSPSPLFSHHTAY